MIVVKSMNRLIKRKGMAFNEFIQIVLWIIFIVLAGFALLGLIKTLTA